MIRRNLVSWLALFFAFAGTSGAATQYVVARSPHTRTFAPTTREAVAAAKGKAKLLHYANRIVIQEHASPTTILEVPNVVRVAATECGEENIPLTAVALNNLNPASDIVSYGNNIGGKGRYQDPWTTVSEGEGGEEHGEVPPLHEDWVISTGTGTSTMISHVSVTAGISGVVGHRECAFAATVSEYEG